MDEKFIGMVKRSSEAMEIQVVPREDSKKGLLMKTGTNVIKLFTPVVYYYS